MDERKYLDYNGLQTFWMNTKNYISKKIKDIDISESIQEELDNKLDKDDFEFATSEDISEIFEN